MTMTTPPLFPMEAQILTSDEHYTERWIFTALGLRFDLDVAAPPGGVPWIPAERVLTMADDGLSRTLARPGMVQPAILRSGCVGRALPGPR